MSALVIVIALVALQRVAELAYAERNAHALLARGGSEIAGNQYPFIVAFHAAWLISMLVFIAHQTIPNWWLIGAFALLQVARIWVISTLGPYWTTRIITVPNEPLVRRGPYRYMRHPNYAIVVLEIGVLPLAFGAWQLALASSLVHGALLWWRIETENAALSPRQALRS